MTKKYLSLDEAAQILGIAPDELVRLREKGDIRGFADRGNWKFKQDDVESLARRRQADSSPEVPLFDLGDESSELEEQPTTIRRSNSGPARADENLLSDDNLLAADDSHSEGSDSDVRLVGAVEIDSGFGTGSDSDSDVKLTGNGLGNRDVEGTDPELPIFRPGSDSEVKLVRPDGHRPDSDSDVKLTAGDSDSDVKLVGEETEPLSLSATKGEGGTDSDLSLMDLSKSDSDVRLAGFDPNSSDASLLNDDDDAIAIDFDPDNSRHASVLDDESGIALTGADSSLLMGESGISLAGPSDSGIGLDLNDDDDAGLTLALDDESGISLDAGESGISLDAVESGISLADSGFLSDEDEHHGTVPMMDIFGDDDNDQTNLKIPALDDDFATSDADVTGVMDLQNETDDVFTLDEETEQSGEYFEEGEDLEFEGESFEDDQDLDVFDAGEDAFEGTDSISPISAGASHQSSADADWGMPTFIGLTLASLLLLVCGMVMIDLVKHTATSNQLNPVSGKLVEIISGPFKS